MLFLAGFLYLLWLGNSVAAGQNVTWISPLRGDVYGSGDTIVGQWDAEKPVRSASFRLCMVDSGGLVKKGGPASAKACGAPVRPTVQQSQGDGSYVIHMVLPNVTISSQCYLEMKDDSGKTSSSPAFSYLPSVEASTDPTGLDVEAMAVPEPSESAETPEQPSPPQFAASASAAQPPAASQSPLSLEDSRIPTPTAAYAVPLSLVSTILVAASGLAIHQRRKLRAERLREQEALKARQSHTLSSSAHSTLDPVGLGLSEFIALGSGPAPAPRSVAGSLDGLGHGHDPTSVLSGSASMSRMRAWRRDVSRHVSGAHVPTHARPDDEETYVARSDDGSASVVSGKAHLLKAGGSRLPSKASFYASTGASRSQPRRTTVPAGMFRESPIGLPYPRDDNGGGEHLHRDRTTGDNKYATYGRRRYVEEEEEEHGRLKRRASLRRVHRALSHTSKDYCQDATTNADGVMLRDADLFSIPLSPAQPHGELASVSRAERPHNGRAFDFDKTPVSPRPGGADRRLYAVVARKVSRGDLV
ncbi:hypothetical protein GSI_07029 [Ganoderma sinense ZZ0214-1]|uniref:Uncharacterized protein n=1 Tax=Ganoderma sinense ZZ0214-1 TaxID=1077348 RepID=A0A2G8SAS6_9APHY|nr:hypothetical protein GSI_07029 [Ganoderma sinense ZZ0214-1]